MQRATKERDLLKKIRSRLVLHLYYDNKIILTEKLAVLLKLISEQGSILSATKSLGISYSRAWEWISNIERLLGLRIVERRRGGAFGGGAILTDFGKKLLAYYFDEAKKYGLDITKDSGTKRKIVPADIVITGSHDVLFEKLIGTIASRNNYSIDVSWTGSTAGLLSILLSECDVSGIHLYEPESEEYNLPFIRKFGLEEICVLVRGYQREIGFAHKGKLKIVGVEEIIENNLRIVNRNPGSGTRILFDQLLREYCLHHNLPFENVKKSIKGYEFEVKTHSEVVSAILSGKADVGLTIRAAAEKYGLKFTHVKWEWYDFAFNIKRLNREAVNSLFRFLSYENIAEIITDQKGYRVTEDTGKIIYAPPTYKISF